MHYNIRKNINTKHQCLIPVGVRTCKYTEVFRLPHCLEVASTYDVQLESHYSVVITCVTVSGTIQT